MRWMLPLVFAVALVGQTQRDIEYARPGGEPQLLDVFVPEGDGPFPAAILVHGGGFEAGDKQTYITYIFEPLSKANFVWFSINYRLSPRHRFPAATDDVETAIRWVRRNAQRYKVDVDRIALIGESAGGHLVSYVGARNLPTARVAAVVSFYGIHDFVSFAANYKGDSPVTERFLGERYLTARNTEPFVAASPIAQISHAAPPFLMIHGKKDAGVPFAQSVEMCAALREASKPCEIVEVDGGHGMDHWEPDPKLHSYKTKMIEWLQKTLQ
ncbi:MAG: alpha/beta hydrolase [Bryobacterales bacterium]